MLERWIREQPVCTSRGLVLAVSAFCFVLLLGMGHAAAAAQATPPTNDKSNRALACKADIQRFCSEANLKQECLVARWDRISAECRNALGTSTGNRADSGN